MLMARDHGIYRNKKQLFVVYFPEKELRGDGQGSGDCFP
jgi:hypothetical protein